MQGKELNHHIRQSLAILVESADEACMCEEERAPRPEARVAGLERSVRQRGDGHDGGKDLRFDGG